MSAFLVSIATLLTRGWTRAYTAGLPSDDRRARLDEIESDLWESWHDLDVDNRRLALQIAVRLLTGMPHDLAWRFNRLTLGVPRLSAGALVATLASLALSGFVVSASGPTIPATQALKVEVVSRGWIDGGSVDGRLRMVPAAAFRLTNVSRTTVRAVQVNALFDGSGLDRNGFGGAWAGLDVGGGLRPGASIVTPLLRSQGGYVGVPEAARADPVRFRQVPIEEATVRLFARCGSDHWRRVAEVPIERTLLAPR